MIGLQYIRGVTNLSLTELAENMGISRQSINQWENGKRPIPQKRLEQLENYFEIPSKYFNKELTNNDKTRINYYLIKISQNKTEQKIIGNKIDFGIGLDDEMQTDIFNDLVKKLENIKVDDIDDDSDGEDYEDFKYEDNVFGSYFVNTVDITFNIIVNKKSIIQGDLKAFFYLGIYEKSFVFTKSNVDGDDMQFNINFGDITYISYENDGEIDEYTICIGEKDMVTVILDNSLD